MGKAVLDSNSAVVVLLTAILLALLVIAFVLVNSSQQAWNAANPSATVDLQAAGRAVQTWVVTQTQGAELGNQ